MGTKRDKDFADFLGKMDQLYVDCMKSVLPLVAQQLLNEGSPKFDMYETQAERIARLAHLIAKFCVQNHHAFRLEEGL